MTATKKTEPSTPAGSPAGAPPGTGTGRPTVASNMAMTALGNAVTPVAALISMPILTYSLGVSGRGELAAATAPLMLAVTAATFGIPEAVAYLVARSPLALRRVARNGAWLILAAGVLATAVCVLAANLLAGEDTALARLIVIASLALIPSLLVLILRACAAGLQRWRLVALEQALTALLRLAGLAALAIAGRLTPLSAIIVIAAAPVLGGLAYLPLRRHGGGGAPADKHLDTVRTRHIMSYGSRIWLGSLTGVLLARLDQTIMTPLSGTYQLGLYAVAVNVSDAALILNSAIRDVTFTSDAAERDDRRLCASARISGFLSLVIGMALAAAVPVALPLVFGPDFAPAIPVAYWLLAAVVLVLPGSIAGAGLSARGHPGLRSASLLVACVVNVLALLLLVPMLGAIGAAIATLVGNVIAGQLNIFFVSRHNAIPARQFYGLRRTDITIMARKLNLLARAAGRLRHGRQQHRATDQA